MRLKSISLVVGLIIAYASDACAMDRSSIVIGGNFEVEAFKDIAYYDAADADPRKHKLDVFIPKGHKDYPVLFFIHGGGWASGDRKMYSSVGSVFAKNGIGTVVISYRLSPKIKHPGRIEDVAKAFAWTCKNMSKYGANCDQIFVTGQSAGGHLAALLATNERYLKAVQLSLKNIKGVMPISGIYNFTPGRFDSILGTGEQAAISASPIKHISGSEPPFLILYAKSDLPNFDRMAKDFNIALKQKNVESESIEIPDRNHITIMLYLMLSEADPSTQALLKFIAKNSGLKLQTQVNKKE